MSSSREAYVWGSNKHGQLGFNPEMYVQVAQPRKLILHEYMNSSNKEILTAIKAKANYSVLVAESKHVSHPRKLILSIDLCFVVFNRAAIHASIW